MVEQTQNTQKIESRPIYGKIKIKGKILAKTGLHIGASKEVGEIGGLDMPVIRDPITDFPYIPGSSLKGKMRSLFERFMMKEGTLKLESIGEAKIHVCNNPDCKICRLFGSSTRDSNIPSRLIVRDSFLTADSKKKLENIESPLRYTELKWENVINRITSEANPRQIERVPAGTEFEFEIIYNIENKNHLKDDLEDLFLSMKLLEDDYLGGHGSRGYGQIIFEIKAISVLKADYYKTGNPQYKKEVDKDKISIWRENTKELLDEIKNFIGPDN